ncbi:hypothetical protein FYJ75_01470 [Roseburia sp. MUC/MUC-530-WT-4D]|uniref:Uncharacterized protein n=1 Tax=Roseburia porci TaxID=2605790 RepID=A0A6L5YMM1_9FIRM|nr:hypothetical protein [Roseburia porci]
MISFRIRSAKRKIISWDGMTQTVMMTGTMMTGTMMTGTTMTGTTMTGTTISCQAFSRDITVWMEHPMRTLM